MMWHRQLIFSMTGQLSQQHARNSSSFLFYFPPSKGCNSTSVLVTPDAAADVSRPLPASHALSPPTFSCSLRCRQTNLLKHAQPFPSTRRAYSSCHLQHSSHGLLHGCLLLVTQVSVQVPLAPRHLPAAARSLSPLSFISHYARSFSS